MTEITNLKPGIWQIKKLREGCSEYSFIYEKFDSELIDIMSRFLSQRCSLRESFEDALPALFLENYVSLDTDSTMKMASKLTMLVKSVLLNKKIKEIEDQERLLDL
uniref:Uncharacterized protein n=1 Tax=viral metagenome TaxID=1070528 RepID=A0A6M3K9Y4_9ZZZZ